MRKFKVGTRQVGTRADVFIAKKYPKFTRSSLIKLFDEQHILANGSPAKPAYKLHASDIVEVDEVLLKTTPDKISLPIIYEDDDVMVIDKPAGMLTHSKGALNLEASVASFIEDKLTDKSLIGNRAGIVHRLDRATSGVIITAKRAEAHRWLQKQFSLRKVKKTYLAVIQGELTPQNAVIDVPIARNPKKPQTFWASSSGKPAQTEYKVLDVVKDKDKYYSILELKPTTGRTHQLRVHLAYIGHPILGDRVYGQTGDLLYLHALSLEITLPNRQRMTFTSPIPEHIAKFINHE